MLPTCVCIKVDNAAMQACRAKFLNVLFTRLTDDIK